MSIKKHSSSKLLISSEHTQGLINFEPTHAQRHDAETTLAQSRLNVVWVHNVYSKVIIGKSYEDSVRRTTIMKKNKIVVKENTTGE